MIHGSSGLVFESLLKFFALMAGSVYFNNGQNSVIGCSLDVFYTV